jgi:hypothetical protein
MEKSEVKLKQIGLHRMQHLLFVAFEGMHFGNNAVQLVKDIYY